MRVVIASRTFVPEVNAAAFRLGGLAWALARRGARVDVITSRPPRGIEGAGSMPGVTIKRWPVLRDAGGNVRGYLQYLSFDIPLAARLIIRDFDVAVAEAPPTTGIVVALVCALRRRPLIYYAADVWTDGVVAVGAPTWVARVMRRMETAVLRRSARILSVSEGVSERLVALGADEDRLVLVGHGIDTELFSPDVAPQTAESPYFIYTGTMSEVHRPHVFLEAFAIVAAQRDDVSLKFFGQGVYEGELRRLAEAIAPGRVEFGGVVPPARVARWIRGAVAALVSLTPGLGYDYAHPTKAYAAAACGTPVIFTGAEAFGRVVVEGDLGEVSAFDAESVSSAMIRMLAARESGETERQRLQRAEWARRNVSLSAVGDRAAAAVAGAFDATSRAVGRIEQRRRAR